VQRYEHFSDYQQFAVKKWYFFTPWGP